MHNEKMADSRDMIGAHDAIRRQFADLPGLISGVAGGDERGTAVVAAHVLLMAEFLHAHHASEDAHVWPKLLDRCPTEVRPVVATMESQHGLVDRELQALTAAARRWSASADAGDRDALAGVADRLLAPLREHLALEEKEVLPLIDRYLTDREWKATVAASLGKVPLGRRPMMLGLALDGADEEQIGLFRAAVPAVAWYILGPIGRRAYRVYRGRLVATGRR
ncbi:hemerythrin domain-containing protein [Actinoplanes sp. NPDC049265]|uniref:hemerythrin domain-containing protein n=1 Tax=Actinoplanes sp. NPDC049265 TaxID=3363902 RepID=UPI00371F924A